MTTRVSTENTEKTKALMPGICAFCKGEFDKQAMTRHLKTCEKRSARLASEKKLPKDQKTPLFQILVEGRYNPQYWMQIEVPATEDLDTLDTFLRRIWVECCDHLSSFRIDGTNYDSTEPFVDGYGDEGGEEGTIDEDEEDNGVARDRTLDMEKFLPFASSTFEREIPAGLLAELKALSTLDEVVAFSHQRLKELEKAQRQARTVLKDHDASLVLLKQADFLRCLLIFEDISFGVKLANVLSTGKKFFYQYDFGSTTHLQLKVLSTRDGVVQDAVRPVEILARNVAPVLFCVLCGKPATLIDSESYSAIEECVYCRKCASKVSSPEEMLPIVNSPRVGVCGYSG